MRGSSVSWEERYRYSFYGTSRAFGLVRNSCAATGHAGSCCQGDCSRDQGEKSGQAGGSRETGVVLGNQMSKLPEARPETDMEGQTGRSFKDSKAGN